MNTGLWNMGSGLLAALGPGMTSSIIVLRTAAAA
jgi:hypothetical protein